MVNQLKQMIESDKTSESSYAGDGDLGDLKFDEAKAKDLGTTIVQFTKVIQALIKQLWEIKSFPGIRCNSLREPVFFFRQKDYVKYLKKETNQIKHLLFVYKI